jgi:hypothetical protein
MARLGSNIRSVAPLSARDRIRSFWIDVFGGKHVTPREDLDVFTFDDGSCLGVYFVDHEEALTLEQQRAVGTWIELAVDDADAALATLTAKGFDPLPYHDLDHRYFQAPGGQVFRLA